MAKQFITVDDITGEPIEDGQGEHIEFSVQGVSYEMDLTKKNADAFHQVLKPYTEKATEVEEVAAPARPARKAPAQGGNKRSPDELKAIREWWRGEGNEISDRGRVPAPVLEAYEAAHKTS